MKLNLALLFVFVMAAVAYTLWIDTRDARPPAATIEAGQMHDAPSPAPQRPEAPAFTFKDMDGKSHSLSDFAGRGVVLNFWASWCAPCIIEFPQMLELSQMVGDDIVFLFLSIDDEKEDIERFVTRYGQSLPLANVILGWDRDKSITQSLYQTYRLPETYLIDAQGRLVDKIIGADHVWNGPDMRARVAALAQTAQKPPE